MAFGPLRSLLMSLYFDASRFHAGVAKANLALDKTKGKMVSVGATAAGLRAQYGLIGIGALFAAGSSVRAFGEMERTSELASIAVSGTTARTREFMEQSIDLAREFKRQPTDVAALTKSIQELGIENDAARVGLARAALQLETLGGVSADQAATGLFRLLVLTQGYEEANRNALPQASRFASVIARVGRESAVSVAGLQDFLQQFQVLGLAGGFTTQEIVALGGALASLNETMRSTSTTALFTLLGLTDETSGPGGEGKLSRIADLMGVTTAHIRELRTTDPIKFIEDFIDAIQREVDAGRSQIDIINELGIVRKDQQKTIAGLIASGERLFGENGLLSKANAEFEEGGHIGEQVNSVLTDTKAGWMALSGAWEEFKIRGGALLSEVLLPILGTLTAIVQTISSNKLLLGAVLGLGGVAVGRAAGRFGGSLLNLIGVGGLLRGGGMMGAAKGSADFARALGGTKGFFKAGKAGSAIGALGGAMSAATTPREMALAMQLAATMGTRTRTPLGRFRSGAAIAKESSRVGLGGKAIGGFLSMFGAPGRFMATKFGAGLATGGAARMTAGALGMGLKVLGGPVGWVLAIVQALQMLAPVFSNLGERMRNLGRQGGMLAVVFNILGGVFNFLALVGNTLTFVFNAIRKGIEDFLNSPVIKPFTDFFREAGDNISDFFGTVSDKVKEANENVKKGNAGLTGGNTQINNFNINASDTGATARQAAMDAAAMARSGISPTARRFTFSG